MSQTPVEIVIALAALEEPVDREDCMCVLCGAFLGCSRSIYDHKETCPWRQAKEWVS